MATIKEEIMSIAEKQGYEGDGGSTIAEAVNALGSVMGGGGGGGGELFVVTFASSGGNTVADKTFDEINDALVDGKFVVGRYPDVFGSNANCEEFILAFFENVPGEGEVAVFTRLSYRGNPQVRTITYNKSTGITDAYVTLATK